VTTGVNRYCNKVLHRNGIQVRIPVMSFCKKNSKSVVNLRVNIIQAMNNREELEDQVGSMNFRNRKCLKNFFLKK
jgi:hypothetical protein